MEKHLAIYPLTLERFTPKTEFRRMGYTKKMDSEDDDQLADVPLYNARKTRYCIQRVGSQCNLPLTPQENETKKLVILDSRPGVQLDGRGSTLGLQGGRGGTRAA